LRRDENVFFIGFRTDRPSVIPLAEPFSCLYQISKSNNMKQFLCLCCLLLATLTSYAQDMPQRKDTLQLTPQIDTLQILARKDNIQVAAGSEVNPQQEELQRDSKDEIRVGGRFYVGVQGGMVFSLYENVFSYWENNSAINLFTPGVSIVGGYDFNDVFGLRLSFATSRNSAACNTRETSGGGFYPYSFQSLNGFVDVILSTPALFNYYPAFRTKLYGGVGGAYTFDFTDSQHPWQKVESPNLAYGFRLGLMPEYNFKFGLAVYLDICGEAYYDMYNGLMPSKEDLSKLNSGYSGFPFDLRGLVSFGLIYRFKK
jgi:hypothetical protein